MISVSSEQIKNLLDQFDFERVHQHMSERPVWRWQLGSLLLVPTAMQLRTSAEMMLRGLVSTDDISKSCGGLRVSFLFNPTRLRLSFEDYRKGCTFSEQKEIDL